MDRLSYTALSGMRAAMTAQTVTANNLANQGTAGFRRDFAASAAALVAGPGASRDSRIHANERAPAADFSEGAVLPTGRPLDVSLSSGSFLAVQGERGEELYTRRGDLEVAPSGLLVNGEGRPVLGLDGPITLPPAERIEIGDDGTLSLRAEGAAANEELAPIARLKLVSPDPAALEKTKAGLFAHREGGAEADPAARVRSGHLEGSNVDSPAELVSLLEQARRFELQVGMLTTARDLDQSSASLLRHD